MTRISFLLYGLLPMGLAIGSAAQAQPVVASPPGIFSRMRVGVSPEQKDYAGTIPPQSLMTVFAPPLNQDPANDLSGVAPWQDMLQIGGTQAENKGFFAVYGQPYGNGSYAVVDQVSMNGMSVAQGTGVSAGPWSTQIFNVNYDAAARGTLAGSAPPRFIASAAIADPDGKTHSVSFTTSGARFTPALPAYWGRILRRNMTVTTNEVGISEAHDPANQWNDPASHHGVKPFRMFSGTITGWKTNADGTVPEITVDNWIVMYSAVLGSVFGFDGKRTGMVPGRDTVDGSEPHLDTDRTEMRDASGVLRPAIFFGVYTKAFDRYTECAINPGRAHGDKNNPNGTIGDQVRQCEGEEMDLWNLDPKDYDASLHGITITANSLSGTKLTDDSYLADLQGGGVMPVGLRIHNVSDDGIDLEGWQNAGVTHWQIFSPTTLPVGQGSVKPLMTLQQALSGTGAVLGTVAWKSYRDVTATGWTDSWATASMHLQFKVTDTNNAKLYPQDENGSIGGQLVFNPAGYQWGTGLGAGGSFRNPNYGLIVDVSGMAHLPHGSVSAPGMNNTANAFVTMTPAGVPAATVGTDEDRNIVLGSTNSAALITSYLHYGDIHMAPGRQLTFAGLHADRGPALESDGQGSLVVKTAGSEKGTLVAGRYREVLSTPARSSSPCIPGEFTDDAHYHYVCTAPSHWKRAVLSDW